MPLWAKSGGLMLLAMASVTYLVWRSPLHISTLHQWLRERDLNSCVTMVTDPEPPLKVRSSPVVAPDNIVAELPNGVRVGVRAEEEGWLYITSPFVGWVYKDLTVTTCPTSTYIPR